MRKIFTLPIMAAFALAACGSDTETDPATGEAMSMDEVEDQMDNAEMPLAGEYRSTQQLLELNAPGVPEQVAEMMRSGFVEGAGEESTFCLTEEDVANGREEMLSGMAENNCTVTRFDVTGNTVDAVMSCPAGPGVSGDVTMSGTMDATSSDMEMSFKTDVPQVGEIDLRMRVQAERIGECS